MIRHTSCLALALSCGLAMAAPIAPTQAAPKSKTSKASKKASKPKAPKAAKVRVLAGGLRVQDLKVGRGALASDGKNVTVHYKGTLTNGKQFDASYDRGQPFSFALGAGQVIAGWDQGVKGMRVGGKRRLVIPAALAYGAQSPSPDIPANSTLVFIVELLGVA